MMRWMLGILLLAATLGGVVAVQADYDAGQRAWDAGRHSEALREWQAAANAGDAKAMLALGRLYMQGLGAPQDYVQAHMWFNLAASRGEAEAVTERDALAARIAPEQVAEAQKQAAAWQPQPSTAPAAIESASPPPPKAIREAQELLVALGYEPDPPDGHWGERTAQAYQAFVRDANLPKTETLTPAALRAMRTMARQAGAASAPKPKPALPPDALHRAAKAGNLKGLEEALAAGMDVNARDDKGWTALMYVVDKGYVLLVEPLMQAKADLDVRAPDGATALFMAVAHGHSEVIPLLMQAGADPRIKGPKGKTATDVAQARYGDVITAMEKGEPPTIIALLAGRTWAEGEELVRTLRQKPPGFVFRDCEQCPEMVVVPPGRFRMGDLAGDGNDDERPVHEVAIDYPFAVGKYEVTFAEWDACVTAGGCTHQPDDNGGGRGTRPVINVSWKNAQEYMRWLSRKTGKPYRLLSEAEWEYVARAGTTTNFWWGDKIGPDDANAVPYQTARGYDKERVKSMLSADDILTVELSTYTTPVGSFEPNAFGLYDTVGNVAEWVEDCWNDSYRGAPSDGSAWKSGDCDDRVFRGGSWSDPFLTWLRLASRNRIVLDKSLGFRVARTLD